MKKLLSVLLALMLLAGCMSGLAEGTETAGLTLPAVGDTVHGFEVKEIRDFPLIGGSLVLYEHQKTGSQVLWFANEDTNRAFELVFPTRPADDNGAPHIFEHATLFGSEKYPSSSLFFGIASQTYNTYMNAMTMDAVTCFPVASLSEAQLLKLADYYTDSCFRPTIMTDRDVFDTQAWRYSLEDAESELTYVGVVYSEMVGHSTLDQAALNNANRISFPGAALSYAYGGTPESIPDLTWESVKAFHDKYYHPSNCLTLLYGRLENPGAFLELLDSYFSGYERAEFTRTEENYTPLDAPVSTALPFPAEEGTDTANQTTVYYYILCPDMQGDAAQEQLADNLCSLMNEDASPLSQGVRDAFPSAQVSCYREPAAPTGTIAVVGTRLNEGDAEAFKAVVDEAFCNVAENGFAPDLVDSAVAQIGISTKLAPESGNPVEGVMTSTAYDFAITGNPFRYAEDVASLSLISDQNSSGQFQEACRRWLVNPEIYTLTATYAVPGEKEKADAALKEKLAGIKAGMSAEELEEIIRATHAEPKEDDTALYLPSLKAVTVENLPEEVRVYPVSDTTDEAGIRHIDVTASVDGIGYAELLLDASALPREDVHWLRLYTRLLGKLDTENHTREELDTLQARYLYKGVTGVDVVDRGYEAHPYLSAEWYALDADLAAGYDLMEELLFHTKFDDPQRLAEEIDAQIAAVRAQINQNAYMVPIYRGMADRYPFYRYYSYLNYLDYYAFLQEQKAAIEETPEAVTARLERIRAFFHSNAGAVAVFAGNEQSIALNRTLADAFMAKLDHEEHEAGACDLPVPSSPEAIIIDSANQHNLLIATPDDMGLEGYDAGMAVTGALACDKILVPVLRDQLGVYTPDVTMMDNGSLVVLAYMDPGIGGTFDVYAGLADQVAALGADQETLDGYIMNLYSELAKPQGELAGAIAATVKVLQGRSQEEPLERMRALKSVTPETVKESAELLRKAWENGYRGTVGSAAAINENADLFSVVLNPFNAKDLSQAEFTDVAEGGEYTEAIRFVMENALMAPAGETEFGTDTPATAGDFYAALYVLAGGTPYAPEEAMALFAQYGLVPQGMEPSTALTGESCAALFRDVMTGLAGAAWEMEIVDPSAESVTRGQLAAELQLLVNALTETAQ